MPGKLCPQLSAGVIAAFGSFANGAIIGWTAPVQQDVLNGSLGYEVNENDFYWMSAIFLLGGSLVCIPTGYIIKIFGRKMSMIVFCIPAIIGWLLIILGTHVAFAYVGRFIIGIGGCAFCLIAPLYCSEIAEIRLRGMLGTLYQLLTVHGVLYVYIVGAFLNTLYTSIACAVLFALLELLILIIPESPVYYISKGEFENAEKSMVWLRGKNYDATEELTKMQEDNEKAKAKKAEGISVYVQLCKPVPCKALSICVVLAVCQQMGGIKAVILFITTIFKDAGTELEPKYISIIFGVVMCASTFVATFVVERAGRRTLLIVSGFGQCVCNVAIGSYFYIKENGYDITNITWMPVLAVLVYVVAYSLGFGPIPWVLLGELFVVDIKGFAGSIVCFSNWFSAFIITIVFGYVIQNVGIGPTFWLFSIVNIFGSLFVLFLLPETKNKTIDEIQKALNENNVFAKSVG